MSLNIPKSFTKEEFQKLTNKTLGNKPQDNNPFQQYKKIITDNYKKDRGFGNYILKEGLSSEALANIDFIFKRIGYKELLNILKDYWMRKNTLFYLLIMGQVKHDFLVNSSL